MQVCTVQVAVKPMAISSVDWYIVDDTNEQVLFNYSLIYLGTVFTKGKRNKVVSTAKQYKCKQRMMYVF